MSELAEVYLYKTLKLRKEIKANLFSRLQMMTSGTKRAKSFEMQVDFWVCN